MRKYIALLCLICFVLVPHACAQPLTALEYVQSLGIDVVQDGDSPGWLTCVYNESIEQDGLKWYALGFSDDQFTYIINDSASEFSRQLYYDLVRNYDWEVSICDDQSTELYDKTFGITNSLDMTMDNYYDKDAYLDTIRTFLKIPGRALEGEFLFRSYPWRININDFSNLIGAEIYPSFSEASVLPIYYDVVEATDTLQVFNPDRDFNLENASCNGLDYTFYEARIISDGTAPMAGYSEYAVELCAIPTILNGRISTDAKNSMVISATYHIPYKNPQPGKNIYDDLFVKLTRLYGNCAETISYGGTTVDAWFGTHDTYLQLIHTELDNGDGLISVAYGLSNVNDMLDELAVFSMQQADINSTDGL